jgi:hypothetical protein
MREFRSIQCLITYDHSMSSWACLSDCFGPRYQPIINPNPIEGMLPGTREVTYYADIENSHAEKNASCFSASRGLLPVADQRPLPQASQAESLQRDAPGMRARKSIIKILTRQRQQPRLRTRRVVRSAIRLPQKGTTTNALLM